MMWMRHLRLQHFSTIFTVTNSNSQQVSGLISLIKQEMSLENVGSCSYPSWATRFTRKKAKKLKWVWQDITLDAVETWMRRFWLRNSIYLGNLLNELTFCRQLIDDFHLCLYPLFETLTLLKSKIWTFHLRKCWVIQWKRVGRWRKLSRRHKSDFVWTSVSVCSISITMTIIDEAPKYMYDISHFSLN